MQGFNITLEDLLFFIITFVIIVLIYVFIINRKRKKYDKQKKYFDLDYLIRRNDLDLRKTSYNRLLWYIAFMNAFIISFTAVVVINIEGLFWRIAVGFALLMTLIYSIYEIVGKSLKRKEKMK